MKRKIMALVLSVATILGSVMSVSASDYTDASSGSMTVTANVTSTYTVRLPATLELTRDPEDGKYKADYTVAVRGQLAATNRIEVTPTPSFEMTDGNHSVNATVTQVVTAWEHDQNRVDQNPTSHVLISPTSYVETTGHIETSFEHLGSYSGTVVFTITQI